MNIGYLYHATEAARGDDGNKLDIAEYIRRECERNAKHYAMMAESARTYSDMMAESARTSSDNVKGYAGYLDGLAKAYGNVAQWIQDCQA